MKAVITVPYTDLEEIFAPEDKQLSNNRASYTMTTLPTGCEFHILADDAVALRAMMSGITKTLSVYEKTKGLIADESK